LPKVHGRYQKFFVVIMSAARALNGSSIRMTTMMMMIRPTTSQTSKIMTQSQTMRCLSSLLSARCSGTTATTSNDRNDRKGCFLRDRRIGDNQIQTTVARTRFSTVPVISFQHPTAAWSTRNQRCRFSTQAAAVPSATIHEICVGQQSQKQPAVRILYASQGGTAQIFAQQLAEGLEDYYYSIAGEDEENDGDAIPLVSIVEGWHEYPNKDPALLLTPGDALHVFLTSVAGVGEAPDNGRAFYEFLMTTQDDDLDLSQLEYTVFGLGNKLAHPNHFNVIGINLDKRLEELGGKRIYPLGLGDDGDCLEDDFDRWMEGFLTLIRKQSQPAQDTSTEQEGDNDNDNGVPASEASPFTALVEDVMIFANEKKAGGNGSSAAEAGSIETAQDILTKPCLPGVTKSSDANNMRRVSAKFPTLRLDPPTSDVVRHDLFHMQTTDHPFYSPSTVPAKVTKSGSLSAYGGEAGLREIRVDCTALASPGEASYRTGDHCLVYPRNAGCVVEAYLAQLDVNPHAIIQGREDFSAYHFPPGLTVYETLSHCVDLGATPSPSFSRFLLGRKDLNYKEEVSIPRRTILDLLVSSSRSISLEDLLFQVNPMKPRHYSIASSSVASPDEICVTFRPIKYMSSQGHLREGVCTNYMASMVAMDEDSVVRDGDDAHTQYMPINVTSNPTFRLPEDPKTSILLIAGGCGVAPIRAFVQERLHLAKEQTDKDFFGQGLVYLGFRTPEDEVHRAMIDKALELGGLTDAKVAYSRGCTDESQYCMNVNKLVRTESERVWAHLESGGYTYLCGGARSFGCAIEQELLELIQEHGNMDFEGAEAYLRNLIDTERLLEDLAD
jgi:NADPH-ferrihemoprotein reductase